MEDTIKPIEQENKKIQIYEELSKIYDSIVLKNSAIATMQNNSFIKDVKETDKQEVESLIVLQHEYLNLLKENQKFFTSKFTTISAGKIYKRIKKMDFSHEKLSTIQALTSSIIDIQSNIETEILATIASNTPSISDDFDLKQFQDLNLNETSQLEKKNSNSQSNLFNDDLPIFFSFKKEENPKETKKKEGKESNTGFIPPSNKRNFENI